MEKSLLAEIHLPKRKRNYLRSNMKMILTCNMLISRCKIWVSEEWRNKRITLTQIQCPINLLLFTNTTHRLSHQFPSLTIHIFSLPVLLLTSQLPLQTLTQPQAISLRRQTRTSPSSLLSLSLLNPLAPSRKMLPITRR